MYLRKLEIHGFKSFAKKTVLEFEPGITSVVGPNGSGKSNLADALRWVFGEQSMKLLRSKKSEDIIFAGSDQKARLGAVEVEVTIDNSDHIMPLDYVEVVITRRLFRDGRSEYLINQNQVRLLDIEELMAKSGFAHSSYHVIGQGMIDQLILGGPAAIKELLEEASGVKPYYMKRDSTLRKLERTETNLGQVQALVEEIEPRLRSLRRQTKRFAQRSEIEAELREAQRHYYGQIFHGVTSQARDIETKITAFDRQIADLTRDMAALSADIESQEAKAQTDTKSFKKLRDDLNTLHQQKLLLQEEQAKLKGKLRAMEEAGANFTPNWLAIKERFRETYREIKEFFTRLVAGGYPTEKLAAAAKAVEDKLDLVWNNMEGTEENRARAAEQKKNKDRLAALEQNIAKLFAQIQKLETDLEQYSQDEHGVKQQLFVKERLLRSKQDALVKTKDQKNSLSVEQAKILTRLENFETEARTALGEKFREEIKSSADQPSGNLTQIGEKIAKLQKQLEMIGGVDDLLVQECRETEERHRYLTTQSADLQKAVTDLKQVIAELDEVIKKDFQEAFVKISEKFSEYFRMLFGGGRATMSILRSSPPAPKEIGGDEEGVEMANESENSNSTKPEIIGIDIRATPPGKKLGGIAALSGGERALTAIALLSSILASYPSPFVVLDEVDAALDEANSIRFGKILGTLAHRTQFITISHNRETMRQSHTLYGVTMGEDGISKLLSLKLEQAAVYSTKN